MNAEDYESEREFYQENPKAYKQHYAGNKTLKFPCPDCGAENAISEWHRKHGYHCDACTRNLESGF